LEESRERGVRWRSIRILGGEPTCHPDFLEIVDLIVRYREGFSPDTLITVVSNGYSERANTLVSRLPAVVRVENTAKTGREQPGFFTFNVAPVDLKDYRRADFSNACFDTEDCGIGVTPYGYYPCAVSGAIDRTFGLDLGRKTLPEDRDDMKRELRTFCALCGKFKLYTPQRLDGPVMSRTWVGAYERSRKSPALLTRLAESPDPGPAAWEKRTSSSS
jgi:hypothetical protein